MADVISDSLQYLTKSDLSAVIAYLRTARASAPGSNAPSVSSGAAALEKVRVSDTGMGADLYLGACAGCHPIDGAHSLSERDLLRGSDMRDPRRILHKSYLRDLRSPLDLCPVRCLRSGGPTRIRRLQPSQTMPSRNSGMFQEVPLQRASVWHDCPASSIMV